VATASNGTWFAFDVTSVVTNAVANGGKVSLRFQMLNDTNLIFGTSEAYTLIGFKTTETAPSLDLCTGPSATLDENMPTKVANWYGTEAGNAGNTPTGVATSGVGSNTNGASLTVGMTVDASTTNFTRGGFDFDVSGLNAITNATLNLYLSGTAAPSYDLAVYAKTVNAELGTNNMLAGAAFSDSGYADTGLRMATNSATGWYAFDVTSVVTNAVANGGNVSFRFQMLNDTNLTFGTANSYTISSFKTTATAPYLDLYTPPATRQYNDWLNVRDFGATGNGTTDDSASIQAAIDAALEPDGLRIVYLPAGTYRLASPVYLASGIRILGAEDEQSILLAGNTMESMLGTRFEEDVANGNMAVERIVFNGGADQNYSVGKALNLGNVFGSVFNDLVFTNLAGVAIRKHDDAGGGVHWACKFKGITIYIADPDSYAVEDVRGDKILHRVTIDGGKGYLVGNAGYPRFSECIFRNSSSNGVTVSEDKGGQFYNCRFTGNSGYGIAFNGSGTTPGAYSGRMQVSDSVFSSNSMSDVLLDGYHTALFYNCQFQTPTPLTVLDPDQIVIAECCFAGSNQFLPQPVGMVLHSNLYDSTNFPAFSFNEKLDLPLTYLPEDKTHVINVRSWGAKGDGVTDDTDIIQDAIDVAPQGTTVHLPAGQYALSSPLVLKSGTILQGVSKSATSLIPYRQLLDTALTGPGGGMISNIVVGHLAITPVVGKNLNTGARFDHVSGLFFDDVSIGDRNAGLETGTLNHCLELGPRSEGAQFIWGFIGSAREESLVLEGRDYIFAFGTLANRAGTGIRINGADGALFYGMVCDHTAGTNVIVTQSQNIDFVAMAWDFIYGGNTVYCESSEQLEFVGCNINAHAFAGFAFKDSSEIEVLGLMSNIVLYDRTLADLGGNTNLSVQGCIITRSNNCPDFTWEGNLNGISQAYPGIPEVPGKIQAENYDFGNSYEAWRDSSANLNTGGAVYRVPADAVDVGVNTNDWTYYITDISDREFLTYTFRTENEGDYRVRLRVRSNGGERGELKVLLDDPGFMIKHQGFDFYTLTEDPVVTVPDTLGEWEYIPVLDKHLTPGTHILFLDFKKGNFDLDSIWIEEYSASKKGGFIFIISGKNAIPPASE